MEEIASQAEKQKRIRGMGFLVSLPKGDSEQVASHPQSVAPSFRVEMLGVQQGIRLGIEAEAMAENARRLTESGFTFKRLLVKSSPRKAKTLALSHAVMLYDPDIVIEANRNRMIALAREQSVATKALFDQWALEDATDDPEELKRRDQETLELHLALNANRRDIGEPVPFPELETEERPAQRMGSGE